MCNRWRCTEGGGGEDEGLSLVAFLLLLCIVSPSCSLLHPPSLLLIFPTFFLPVVFSLVIFFIWLSFFFPALPPSLPPSFSSPAHSVRVQLDSQKSATRSSNHAGVFEATCKLVQIRERLNPGLMEGNDDGGTLPGAFLLSAPL